MPGRCTISVEPVAKTTDTKSFVLRIDAATMEALERWADDEFRSINGQIQWIVSDALRRAGRTPKAAGQPEKTTRKTKSEI